MSTTDKSTTDNSFLVKSSKPRESREETVAALESFLTGSRPAPSDIYGGGPLLVSDVPLNARQVKSNSSSEDDDDSKNNNSKGERKTAGSDAVILGIDEAGRGPVLGPMVYGAAYWCKSDSGSIPKDFNDSKQLSVEKRMELFEKIKQTPQIGFVVRALHASEISRNMLRKDPYNLNAMSHDAAMQMIRAVLDAGVKIDTCYVDTVGIAQSYQTKLEREFDGHGIRFVVEKKADAKYAPCSAASVVAKVSRDVMTSKWKFSEPDFEPVGGPGFGSGYPSDPKCKEWIEKNLSDPVFGFPDFTRFSWGPMKKIMDEKGVPMAWEADDEDEEDNTQTSLTSFVTSKKRKKPRLAYFEKMGLSTVDKLVVT